MSFWKATEVMASGHIVIHKDVTYAIINERICACRFDIENNELLHSFEIDSSVNLLALLFDTFVPHFGNNVFKRPPVPETYVIEDGMLYDFSRLPEHTCQTCFTWCGKKNVVREGKYALCPGCNRRFFRASRLDGTVEDAPKKEPKKEVKKVERPERPKPPTNEEIINKLLQDESRQVKRKLKF